MKKTIKDIDIKDKRVLMRVDFNVPLNDSLKVTDDTRIKAALPTIRYILEKGAKKLILMSHLGRPDGKIVEKLKMAPVAKRLQELLGEPVGISDPLRRSEASKDGRVVLLENLRFNPEEENNDPSFAKRLASLGDIYVNDAFGTAHRAHASTEGVAHYLPAVAGFLMEREIEYLSCALKNPKTPFIVILGGAKVSDKIGVIMNLLNISRVDEILIGGGMAYTFLKAKGKRIGNSRLEPEKLGIAKEILQKAEQKNIKIILPIDNLVAERIDPQAETQVVGEEIPVGFVGVDIGPKTTNLYKETLKKARTIVWNGPLGIFEMDAFSRGTEEVARFIANLKKAATIIGGGDTVSAINKFNLQDKMTHISTGGGASLEFLEGKLLPGIAALNDKNTNVLIC